MSIYCTTTYPWKYAMYIYDKCMYIYTWYVYINICIYTERGGRWYIYIHSFDFPFNVLRFCVVGCLMVIFSRLCRCGTWNGPRSLLGCRNRCRAKQYSHPQSLNVETAMQSSFLKIYRGTIIQIYPNISKYDDWCLIWKGFKSLENMQVVSRIFSSPPWTCRTLVWNTIIEWRRHGWCETSCHPSRGLKQKASSMMNVISSWVFSGGISPRNSQTWLVGWFMKIMSSFFEMPAQHEKTHVHYIKLVSHFKM